MADVKAFIDAVGRDVTDTVVPRIEVLANEIHQKTQADYGPKVSAFANELVKEIINDQAATLRAFTTALLHDLFQRYQPEVVGELHTRIVQGGVEVVGHGVKLDLKRRDTGASVSSLDIPVAIKVNLGDLSVSLRNASVKLDVIK